MPEQTSEADHASLHREKARLRSISLIILVLGLAAAGIVYWHGTRAEDARLAEYEQSQARAESRQMQMLYGTSGGLMQDFFQALKQPRNQALTIAGVTIVIAAACFYLGRPLADNEDMR